MGGSSRCYTFSCSIYNFGQEIAGERRYVYYIRVFFSSMIEINACDFHTCIQVYIQYVNNSYS